MRLILEALARHAADRPKQIAVVDPDGSAHSWESIADRARRVQTFLDGRMAPGAFVAISIASGSHFWCALLGIAGAGRVPVLVPCPLPRTIADRIASDLGAVVVMDEARCASAQSESACTKDSADPAGVVLLSSGTTGHSRFIFRPSEAIDRVATTILQEGLTRPGDASPCFMPMAHAYGFEHACLAPILAGARIHAHRAFSVNAASQSLADGATTLCLVPATAEALAEHAPPATALRCIVVAGAALTPNVRKRLLRAFPVDIVDLYGASETGTIWLDRGKGGRMVPGVSVRIVDATNTSRLVDIADGREGEIAVRSDAMGDAILAEKGRRMPLLSEGFFRTGDLGLRGVDGTFRITGRAKLVFDVGGLKVNPIEVEQAVESHPAIARAMIHPIRAGESLNRVGLKVELRPGAAAPAIEELRSFLAPLIASHAMPRSLDIRNELPKTASGKVMRLAGTDRIEPVLQRLPGLEAQEDREAFTKKLFDETACRYDASSATPFLGSGRWHRRRMLLQCGLRAGSSLLDVGCGTGLCASIAQDIVGPAGRVAAIDPSTGMLEMARRRGVRETVVGRAESLPFDRASFDFISMSYMLRHIEDLRVAFAEARRVLKPGGRILILEVTRPEGRASRGLFDFAMKWCAPTIGVVTSGRPSTFPMMRYWAQTIEQAVRPPRIIEALESCGFIGTRHILELGIFSSYRGVAPPA
ncbi:MAG: AMP-binding protein [Planctomycetes bacterium]|nr:AMP-binding protein [Planctomycetota bacterium]